MAKLECLIKREGGTIVEIDDVKYHFEPQEDGAHVAEVGNIKHLGVLLKITEAYAHYKTSPAPGPTPAQLAAKEAAATAAKEKAEADAAAAISAAAQALVDKETATGIPAKPLTPAQKAAATKAAKAKK